jgi:SAGA-associated factor 73
LELRICPYCSRPFWVSALEFHIESSCIKAPLKRVISKEEDTETFKNNGATIVSSPTPTKSDETSKVQKTKKRKQDLANSSPASTSSQLTTPNAAGAADSDEPKKKVRKVSMTKKRRLALEAATAAALARGEKPPTLEDIKEDLLPRKKKREKYKSQAKAKLPVDVDKQCGVPLANGALCARSLTCKTHSMGAKRSVLGRSGPYDLLLANYQKRNQIKLASLSHSQQLADENAAFGDGAALNSDEEVVQVLEGVTRAAPVPLEQKVLLPTRIKNQFFKMREMLADALLPARTPRVPTALGGLLCRANAISSDKPHELHFIRPVTVPRPQHLTALKQQHKLIQLQQLQQQHQLQQQQQLQQSMRVGAGPQAKILAAQHQHQALQLLPPQKQPPPQQQQQQSQPGR